MKKKFTNTLDNLSEGTKDDEVKYDACRILAGTYKAIGEYGLARDAIEQIPDRKSVV